MTTAKCQDGVLYVTTLSEQMLSEGWTLGNTYHMLDYNLFAIDIRQNAQLRVKTYLDMQQSVININPE